MIDRKRDVETCLVIVTGLLVFYYFNQWGPLLIAALLIGTTGIFLDKPASWISWLWYKIAELLGAVVSKILLSAVYFIFLYPVAMLYRLSRKDRLGMFTRRKNSLWTDRAEHTYTGEDMRNPW